MSHNKKKHHKKHGVRAGQVIGGPLANPKRGLFAALTEVERLVKVGEIQEARATVLEANERYPDRIEVLGMMTIMGEELADSDLLLIAAEGLYRIAPDDPETVSGLGSIQLLAGYSALGLVSLRKYLGRWPDHPDADKAREIAQTIEAAIAKDLKTIGLPPDQALEVMAMNDQARRFLELSRWEEARRTALRILEKLPHFAPALNNLSTTYYIDGDYGRATATAALVLETEPDNVHALANLAHWSFLMARFDEAREFAERLKTSKAFATDREVKIAEALTYLGDDRGVLEAFEAARASAKKGPPIPAIMYHLAGVAAMRLGREAEARRRWRRALEIDPDFVAAQDNLEESELPIGEREGPWAFELSQWVHRNVVDDLARIRPRAGRQSEEEVRENVRAAFRRHPEVESLLPALLDRCGPLGRQFAIEMAAYIRTPESLAALRDFALGQRGADTVRMSAAQAAMQAGAIPPGNVRMWWEGQWKNLLLFGWDLNDEPTCSHSPKVSKMCSQAIHLLRERKFKEAEALLLEASKIEPDKPDIWNNIATAYQLQERTEEAIALFERIYRDWPDYIFGQIQRAVKLINEDKLDEAEALLNKAMQQSKMNIEAFGSLCDGLIRLYMLRMQPDSAQSWLNMRRQVLEDDEQTEERAQKIQIAKALVALQEFGRRPRRGKHRDKVNV